MSVPPHEPEPAREPASAPMPRRRFLRRLATLGAGAAFGAGGWQLGTRSLEVCRVSLALPGLGRALRAVFLSDTHLCTDAWKPGHCSPRFLADVVRRARDERPDLLFFGGDLASPAQGGLPAARQALALLAEVAPAIGAWGVLGNHDIKYSRDAVAAAYSEAGLHLLRNEWVIVECAAGRLALGGVEFRRDPLALARRLDAPPSVDTRILLAHDPAIVYDLGAEAVWCDLILSGHTHGGQVVVPLIGSPWARTPANPDYMRGLFLLQEGPALYVNRGIGTVLAPFRIGSRPEITVFELTPAPRRAEGQERGS